MVLVLIHSKCALVGELCAVVLVSAERYSVQKKGEEGGRWGTWTRADPTHLVMVYLSRDHRVVLDGNLNFRATNSP